jgi:uncharacterized protein YjiK
VKKYVFAGINLLIFVSFIWKLDAQDLKLLNTFQLDIPEPSGICVLKNHLYVVSDSNGSIYKITKKGQVVDQIQTKLKDIEGVTYRHSSQSFLMIDEGKRKVIEVDISGTTLSSHKIGKKQDSKNSGLEGICCSMDKSPVFVLNEKNPRELIKLDEKFKVSGDHKLKFGKDISGCTLDKDGNLWMVSDQSKEIYKTTKKGKLLMKYKIPVKKAEGIAIDHNKIYVVSDKTRKMYVFRLPN